MATTTTATITTILFLASHPHSVTSSIDLNLVILGSSYDSTRLVSAIANLTNATQITVQQPQPDTVTGLVCAMYFANVTTRTFYKFELVHITRLQASLVTDDEAVAQIKLQYMLSSRVSDFAAVYILSSNIHGDQQQPWYTQTVVEIPQYLSQYLLVACCILLLAITLLSILLCLPPQIIEHAVIVTPAPPPVQPRIDPPLPTAPPRPPKLTVPDSFLPSSDSNSFF